MKRARSVPLALILSAAAGAPGLASPASAIPWLTESLAAAGPQPTAAPAEETISESAMGTPQRNGTGVLTSQMSGLPRDLWRGLTVQEAVGRLTAVQDTGPPATTQLFLRLLLAETEPPSGPDSGDTFLTARVDRLLRAGALSQAEALIEAARPDTTPLFRRWFDIELLTGHGDRACAALQASPMLSPSTKVKIFCLARAGDWDAAGIALQAAERIGDLGEDDATLLALFIDPNLAESIDPPHAGRPMRVLEFVIREAVGLPVSRADLPIAFLHADTAPFVPTRFRISAAEKLTAAGSLDGGVLFAIYREEVPAASGGVWDRAAAVQAVDLAVDHPALAAALAELDKALAPVGLRVAAARHFAPRLETFAPSGFDAAARALAARYLLLGGRRPAPEWIDADAPLELRAAAVAAGVAVDLPADLDAATYGALAPFLTATPLDLVEAEDRDLIAEERIGAALLRGIARLSRENWRDSGDLSAGLALLVAAGQAETARQAAVEVLLARPHTQR